MAVNFALLPLFSEWFGSRPFSEGSRAGVDMQRANAPRLSAIYHEKNPPSGSARQKGK